MIHVDPLGMAQAETAACGIALASAGKALGRPEWSQAALKAAGGNSWRTWGVGQDTQGQLDQAQTLGMTVTLGIWLGHADSGFHWDDAKAVAAQKEMARQAILQYR